MAGTQGRGLRRVLTAVAVVAVLGGVAAGPAGATSSAQHAAVEGGPRVIGGQPVTPGQYPWLVAVVDHNEPRAYEGQFCGATVVAPNWVMTAWHCVVESLDIWEHEDGSIDATAWYADPSGIDVVAGRSDLTSAGGERVGAAQIVPLPSAKAFGSIDGMWISLYPVNDLALIRLKAPLSAPPIRLATPGDALALHAARAGHRGRLGHHRRPGRQDATQLPDRGARRLHPDAVRQRMCGGSRRGLRAVR